MIPGQKGNIASESAPLSMYECIARSCCPTSSKLRFEALIIPRTRRELASILQIKFCTIGVKTKHWQIPDDDQYYSKGREVHTCCCCGFVIEQRSSYFVSWTNLSNNEESNQ